jgi:hypothetical protein
MTLSEKWITYSLGVIIVLNIFQTVYWILSIWVIFNDK